MNKHNLKWWAAYGTAIGAVRHHNIIPWDDDVDICMPREDFDKLSNLKGEFDKTPYKLMVMGDDDLFTSESKIVLRESSWQEKSFHFCNTGVYIDIFPLDSIDNTIDDIVKIQNRFLKLNRKYYLSLVRTSLSLLLDSLLHAEFKDVLVQILGIIYPYKKKAKYLQDFNALIDTLKKGGDCGYLVSFCGIYGKKDIFNRELFAHTIEMPFDDFYVKMPARYDEWLRNIYGNYMQLPPEEKRISHHNQYYVNLSRRLSHSGIVERVKQNITHEM